MRIAILLLILLLARLAPAQDAPPVDSRWLAIFEQSYGSEGLYVIEVKPGDAGGQTRLDLQLLNAAAQEYLSRHPGKTPTLAALDEEKLLADLPEDRRVSLEWDQEQGLFTSTLGPQHSPAAGIINLLQGNEAIRRRLLEPDRFTRDRWSKIYKDAESPEFLKREILLREFVIDHTTFPEAVLYERTQQQLALINDAVNLFGMSRGLKPNDPVTFADLRESGMFGTLGHVPDNVEFTLNGFGAKARATINGVAVTAGPEGLQLVRRNRVEALLRQRPDYPPALLLAARYRTPEEGLKLLDKAITIWPDVPGLRVERLGTNGRRRNFAAWTTDMDFILRTFPAAPLLIEIDLAAEAAGLAASDEAYAQAVLVLADIRPDLLTHQLLALRVLEKANRIPEAQTVYDRLVYANPAWRVALDRPVVGTE